MQKIVALAAVCCLCACASTSNSVRGNSAADEVLKTDTYRMFSAIAAAKMKCEKIDYAEVTASEVTNQIASETWVAHGCGKSLPYAVTFVPSLAGGYSYQIRLQ